MKQILIQTLDRTISGKTTFSKHLSKILKFTYIYEGSLNRAIITNNREYYTQDSLSGGLRDIGYKESIKLCSRYFTQGQNIILNASFHKLFRRKCYQNCEK